MKKIFSIFAAILFAGSMMAGTVTLTNANIVAAGDAASGYQDWAVTDGASRTWNAHAIKNKHSNATADKHFLQLKKYVSSPAEAFYIQIPNLGENIQSITMTVSSTSKPMDGGGNAATVFFSASNSTSAAGDGVASGTGESSITIDASELALQTGYITAGGAVRIWDITVTTAAAPAVAKPIIGGDSPFFTSTHVTITCATTGSTVWYTTNGLDPDLAEDYTNEFPSAGLDITETTTFKAIAVTGTGLETKFSEIATKTFTKATASTIAEVIAANTGGSEGSAFLLNEVTVTYVNGKNTYAKDATGSILIYDQTLAGNAAAGSVLSGLVGKAKVYKSLPEISTVVTQPTVTPGTPVDPVELSVAPTVADNLNQYVKLKNVNFAAAATFTTSDNTTTATGTMGSTDLTFRNTFKIAQTIAAGKTYDIVAIVSTFDGLQILPISFTDVATAIDNTVADENVVKTIENGQLVIIKNGIRYNAQGNVLK